MKIRSYLLTTVIPNNMITSWTVVSRDILVKPFQDLVVTMSNVDDLLDRCRQASSEAIEKSNSLTEFNARSRKQLLAASNEFFVELLDLAQAIAGEYDKTALTPAVRNHTLTQLNELIAVGEKIKAIAEDAENHVDTTDQQIANIVDEQLIPTLNEAKQRQASLQAQLSSVQNEVSTLQERANQAEQTAIAAKQELDNAKS